MLNSNIYWFHIFNSFFSDFLQVFLSQEVCSLKPDIWKWIANQAGYKTPFFILYSMGIEIMLQEEKNYDMTFKFMSL